MLGQFVLKTGNVRTTFDFYVNMLFSLVCTVYLSFDQDNLLVKTQ